VYRSFCHQAGMTGIARAGQSLKETFGFDRFRGRQEEVVARVLAGDSTLAVMPTGAGKSLTYQLPAVMLPGTCVVISPLIALMHDQLRSDADQRRCRLARNAGRFPRRRARSALCRARTCQPAGFPRPAGHGTAMPVRDRRGALRVRMGA
jgi:Rad3-related DNA helicase